MCVHCLAASRLLPLTKALRSVFVFSPPWGVAKQIDYDKALSTDERQVHMHVLPINKLFNKVCDEAKYDTICTQIVLQLTFAHSV